MNLKSLFCRHTFKELSKLNRRISSLHKPYFYSPRNAAISSLSSSFHSPVTRFWSFIRPSSYAVRCIHTMQQRNVSEDESEEDAAMNDFLSRFVWIMRGKLSEAYPDSDKSTIDAMLLIIVEKVVSEMEKGGLEQMIESGEANPAEDFSPDLWRTVWEVSSVVLDDMQKAQKKEKMKYFLQSEEVQVMSRFAGEIGIRGDMLRELRFKWAREKMEESEFYESLESLRQEAAAQEDKESGKADTTGQDQILIEGHVDQLVDEEKHHVASLPKRHGKLKYKIYGLDLSDPKWAEVADKVHESEEIIWPQEAKPITGKCKIVSEKILSLELDDDPSQLLAEWVELLQPNKVDWNALLDRLKGRNHSLYLKIAELLVAEETFETNIRDYSKLIDAYAKENCLEDAERILKKMNDNGIPPDILTSTTLVHMYSKAGNLEKARDAFENLKSPGSRPDMKVYNSMIMAYVNAGKPREGEHLMRDMETKDMKPTRDIYMALLRSFSQMFDTKGAERIATGMEFAGFESSMESCMLLIEAYKDLPEQARYHFDHMLQLGHKPDDKCTASMIAAYGKKNMLDKALNLLLQLEKDGFEPGIATYTALLDWFSKLQLIDEAEQILNKISELGEAPPLKVHVSLCDLYLRAKMEKKALQALGVVESKKDKLEHEDFERIIIGLIDGGFSKDAQRMYNLMEAQGYSASKSLEMFLLQHPGLTKNRH